MPLFAQEADADFQSISSVEFVESDANSPPPETANWQAMELPLGSRLGSEEDSGRTLWFRFELAAPKDDRLHALYFYRHNLSIDVFFNNELIGGDTYRESRHTMSWNHPRIIPIQPANWRSSSNIVHVRFQTSYFGGTFAPALFGPAEVLQIQYEERLFRQVTINQWMQYAGFIALALSLTLWGVRRNDRTYLLFAGMAACWIVLATHMVIYYNPITYRYWLPLVHISTDLWGFLFFHFLVRLTNLPAPKSAKAIRYWLASSLAWNVLAPIEYWWIGAYVSHAMGNLFIFYVMARIIRKAFTQRDGLAIAICATICVQVSFFTHDFLLVLLASPEDWESAFYFSQFAFPLLMLVFAGALLQRFISALSEAEKLNRELEDRVEASRQLIERSFEEKHELELKQAAARERIDIYRDLHDDVGSKLLSIVHAGSDTQNENKAGELARTALESLRNAVSRANSPEQSLTQFLEELKEEANLRLAGSGHAFNWNQFDPLPTMQLGSDQVFNLNQIFRELVSNIIRHAEANAVEIRISSSINGLNFRISDNGKGINELDHLPKGNGLGNIESRVAELEGHVSWRSNSPSGLTVELNIPMNQVEDVAANPA